MTFLSFKYLSIAEHLCEVILKVSLAVQKKIEVF